MTPAERMAAAEFAKGLKRVKAKTGKTQEQVAAEVGVSQGMMYQWQKCIPIPADRARAVAAALEEIDPGKISVEFRELTAQGGDIRTPALIVNQLENDVDALRYAVGVMATVFAMKRPDEGAEFADAIRATVPQKFLERGIIFELLEMFDRTADAAKAAPSSRRGAKPARG